MLKRSLYLIGVLCLAFLAVSPAQGAGVRELAGAKASGCGKSDYSYAGLQSLSKAHGVSATLMQVRAPSVIDGHVGGWVGVAGTSPGNNLQEWLQVGFAGFEDSPKTELYYEVTRPGVQPKYFTVLSDVLPGEKHHVSVLEMSKRKSFWRVWVDNRPVSPPIYLPGSHGAWYPQIVGENWAGTSGACNAFTYRFTDVSLASSNGGNWKPLVNSSPIQDKGYRVLSTAATPNSFVALNL